jgi:enoyl-CoA hydratase/carnithine racemase
MTIVQTEDRGAVRHVVMNRPEKRNAINRELFEALGAAFAEAAGDPGVRCVVVRGEGKVFSAGIDLGELATGGVSPDRLREFRSAILGSFNRCEEMPKPVIAQIHGACFGAGLELALACDLRVVALDAKLGLPETRLGLIPDVGGSSRLPAVVGLGRAKELIMTSRTIDGAEAERIGLANRAVPATELDAATQALGDELLGCSQVAVGLAKRVLDSVAKPALAATLEAEVTAQEVCVREAARLMAAAAENGGGAAVEGAVAGG